MGIDDPIDAAEKQIAADESSLPAQWTQTLVRLVGQLPYPARQIVACLEHAVNKRRSENQTYLLKTLANELKYAIARLHDLSAEHERFIQEEIPGLVVEAHNRATQAGSKRRIQRFAKIVAYAIEVGPAETIDTADEMLRIASELSDEDIRVLRDLNAACGQLFGCIPEAPNINNANSVWKTLQEQDPFYKGAGVHSTCAKLQSFGLVTAVERIPTVLGLDSIPYWLLPRGRAFLEYIREAAS